MAKRVTAPKKGTTAPGIQHVCGECKHGNWVESSHNLDWQGNPICLTCPYQQYHILRGRKACHNFKPKEGVQ